MNDTLLAPIDADTPCGPNLEYDADFLLLQEYASGKSEQQYGDTLIAAQPPDWSRIEQLAVSLLARTKDLRVLVQLTRAWMQADGLSGLARGLHMACALLDRYWDAVHPALTVDGQYDPLPRVNVLREMAGSGGCLHVMREWPLFGATSVRSIASALARHGIGAREGLGGCERIADDLRAAHGRGDPTLATALDALDALCALRATLHTRLGQEWALDESALERDLSVIAQCLHAAKDHALAPVSGSGQTSREPESRPSPAMTIDTRADANLCLDALCSYFERHEPSHPAPLLLRRVQRLLTLNFYEIMRDIAPEGLGKLDALSGRGADNRADGDGART
ncbi:type VI secretion system protein TssA [Trinickia sp. Y13]|uniref:type VI secretion system protein TssA n=1 Tax=Trinickia sp. Y13 TaxID=2917807 RepID=UPI00240655EA|nr:type VI secretion system protein TssA [Trinickia sp. Y13]MDG0023205.1 type VI secretion system protein TssA [Trinickia sp. Y13]